MICLALDTAGSEGGVALAEFDEGGNLLPQRVFVRHLPPREISSQLIPAILGVLAEAQREPAAIDCLAAVSGPGSFTGIRVGLAAVKGLADARSTPVLGVSRLALLAAVGRAAAPEAATTAYSLLDAGRGELYVGAFAAGAPLAHVEAIMSREALEQTVLAAPAPVYACEPTVAQALADCFPALLHAAPPPGVTDLLPFVDMARSNRHELRFETADRLQANYVRQAYPARPQPTPVAP